MLHGIIVRPYKNAVVLLEAPFRLDRLPKGPDCQGIVLLNNLESVCSLWLILPTMLAYKILLPLEIFVLEIPC